MDSKHPVPVPQPVENRAGGRTTTLSVVDPVRTKGASSEEYALGTGNSEPRSSNGPRHRPVEAETGVRSSGGASDQRLHALCCQAFDLKGTGYLRDACDAIVVEWHRRHLVELLRETA